MSVGHVLDHVLNHILDHMIIGLVATALQHIYTGNIGKQIGKWLFCWQSRLRKQAAKLLEIF